MARQLIIGKIKAGASQWLKSKGMSWKTVALPVLAELDSIEELKELLTGLVRLSLAPPLGH